jgi:hypothetical protein
MNDLMTTRYGGAKRRHDRLPLHPSVPPARIGGMTQMVLFTIGAAVLTGILTLPFTMPGGAFAAPPTTLVAKESGLPAWGRPPTRPD